MITSAHKNNETMRYQIISRSIFTCNKQFNNKQFDNKQFDNKQFRQPNGCLTIERCISLPMTTSE